MTAADRQAGFDGAVKLLLDEFPGRGSLVIMDSLWEKGDRYLQQIKVIAENWRNSQGGPEALKATVDFCNLMADCAWFVHDNDAAGVLALVVDSARDAYHELPDSQKERILEADILLLLCIKDLRAEGDFVSAEGHGKKSLVIRDDLNMPQDLQMTNCYNYIAIACDSMGRHDDVRSLLGKSRVILEGNDDKLHLRLLCQNNLNFSRTLFSLGKFDDSEKKLSQGLAQATSFDSWYTLAFIHQTKANLYLRWGKVDQAADEIVVARTILESSGGFASISWISGIVSYRASTVAIAQKKTEVAIDEANKAAAIARLYKMPLGMQARFNHLLMKAYLLEPDKYGKDAEEARQEAQRLRKLLPPGKTDLEDESDEAFDKLVDISVR